MKKFRSVLALTLIMMLLCAMVPAVADSSYYFTIYNHTGQSISEIYIYPSNNSRFGDPRNTKGYIRDGESAKIYVSAAEMRMPGTFNVRMTLVNSRRSSTWYSWSEQDLSSWVGYEYDLTFTSDGRLNVGYHTQNTTATSKSDRTVMITNYTGDSITEVYIYPSNNSKWGYSRTKNWISNYDSATFTMDSSEINVNTEWTIKLCFKDGRYSYTVTWDEWDIDSIIGHELTVYKSSEDTYTISTSSLNSSF